MTSSTSTAKVLAEVGVTAKRSVELVVGLDVGGTKTLAVVVEARDPRTVVAQVRRATDATGASGVLATVTDTLVQVTAAAGTSPGSLAAVGVGIPGIVDPTTGGVRHAVHLGIGSQPVDLVGPLRRLVGHQVVVANDVDLAALGASELLATGGDVAYLSIGTGVAAGFVIRGEVHQGMHGAAGEIGHLPVDPGGAVCECGQRGCLETVASGSAIVQRWHALGDGHGSRGRVVRGGNVVEASGLAGRVPGPSGAGGAAALFAAAASGDTAAAALRDEICGHLATAVALVGQTVDPAHVVLGGGVAEVGAPLLDGVRAALGRRAGASPLLSALALDERVVLLPQGMPAGALGAALAARNLLPHDELPPSGEEPSEVWAP